MKIITVNLPSSFIDEMEAMTGNESLYPSRSELIRVAVRDYLVKTIKRAEQIKKEIELKQKPQVVVQKSDEFETISIPVSANNEMSQAAAINKSYKIIKK